MDGGASAAADGWAGCFWREGELEPGKEPEVRLLEELGAHFLLGTIDGEGGAKCGGVSIPRGRGEVSLGHRQVGVEGAPIIALAGLYLMGEQRGEMHLGFTCPRDGGGALGRCIFNKQQVGAAEEHAGKND